MPPQYQYPTQVPGMPQYPQQPNPFGSFGYPAPGGGRGNSMNPFQTQMSPFSYVNVPQLQRRSPVRPGQPQGIGSYQSDPLSRFVGYSGASQGRMGTQGAPGDDWDWANFLPRGGIYGDQKWMPGNGIDVFTRRGEIIRAPADGMVQAPTPNGMIFSDAMGKSARMVHVQPMAQGRVRRGQPIGMVNDPMLDMLGPYPGMPDGFQHVDLAFASSPNGFSYATPGAGGDIAAAPLLRMRGYGRPIGGQTRGPGGGGGMGGPGGMMGGPMMGMPGGMMGGGPPMMPPMMGNPFMMPGMMPPMMGGGMGMGGPMGMMNPFMMMGRR